MNKKIIRNLLIFFVVIAVLGGAYMYFTRPETPEEISHIEIFTHSRENVETIKIENRLNTFTLTHEGEEWKMEEYPDLPVYQVKANNLSYTVTSVYAQSVVEEGAVNLEKYGLSDPRATVTVSFSEGKEETFLLGNDLAIGTDAYFMRVGDSTVYTVTNLAWEDALLESSQFFDMALPDIEKENVLSLEILKKDGNRIFIERNGGADAEYLADWRLVAPVSRAAENNAVENLLGSLKNLSAINVFSPDKVRVIPPNEHTATATIHITLKEGKVTYYVGERGEEGVYFKVEGTGLLYLASEKSFSFLSEDAFTFMDKRIVTTPIKDVNSVDITLLGNLYTLGVGDEFTLNGASVSEEAGRSVYSAVLSLKAEALLEETKLPFDEENVITFHLKEGNDKNLLLKEENGIFYADAGDGLVFRLAPEGIENIKETLE